MLNLKEIEDGARLMLQGLGVDLADGNFSTTPQRVAKVMKELFVPSETEWPVFEEDYTDLVLMRGHVFYTLCPHHMLPVKLTAYVAYIPNGAVIGASKLCRMLHDCNRMPMTQEKLTQAALASVDSLTRETSRGAAVMLLGEHGCFQMRGIRSCANMATLKFSGVFHENGDREHNDRAAILQQRFLTLAKI